MFYGDIYIFYFHILMVKTYGPSFGPLKKQKLPFTVIVDLNVFLDRFGAFIVYRNFIHEIGTSEVGLVL